MNKLFAGLILVLLTATPVKSAELLMFSSESCIYCRTFIKEVWKEYVTGPNQRILPLKIVDYDGLVPLWFQNALDNDKIDGIGGTPTFVVFNDGEEVGRLLGYPGKNEWNTNINTYISQNRKFLQDTFGKNEVIKLDLEMLKDEANKLHFNDFLKKEHKHEGSHNNNNGEPSYMPPLKDLPTLNRKEM